MSTELPICPRCQELTPREAGAVGWEIERQPTRITKAGKVIAGENIQVRKRQWRCLKCEKVYVVPEVQVKEKQTGGKTKTKKRRKRGNSLAGRKRRRKAVKV